MAKILSRVPDELKEGLQAKAGKMGLTLNALILQILWEWLKNDHIA